LAQAFVQVDVKRDSIDCNTGAFLLALTWVSLWDHNADTTGDWATSLPAKREGVVTLAALDASAKASLSA
jgi:hypothetical protein